MAAVMPARDQGLDAVGLLLVVVVVARATHTDGRVKSVLG